MAILHIYQDSVGKGTCRSCGASITWAELTSGKRHPFNGTLTFPTHGGLLNGRVIEAVDTSITTSHFASCPDAKKWRR